MAEVIIMPKLGFNMDSGQLVTWHKKVGDAVKKGEPLFDINTDKTTMPVEATQDGVLLKVMLAEGESADVFTPIAVVGAAGENPDAALAAHGGAAPAAAKPSAPAAKAEPTAKSAPAASAKTGNYDHEITVIGGGPGGYVAAIKAAREGKKVCLIEEKHLGGVCLNEGCIPTKTLLKTANLLSEIRHAGEFAIEGIQADKLSVNMARLQERRKKVIATLVGGVKGLVRGNKITLIEATARFVDAHTVEAGGKRITSEHFIIATGSDVFMPPFIALEGKNNILTSREALTLDKVPASVAIIGGGVIGVEFASLLGKLGAKVTVLELLENLMPMVDPEVSALAKKRLEKDGIVFRMQAKVTRVKDNTVHYELAGREETVKADAVLMAVGRVPRTEGLGAAEIGIEFDRRAVKTDAHLRTNIPNIYCIGDVNGKVMLAHVASHEGMLAVENILGHDKEMNYNHVPSCIYLDPEIACIGLTEAQAKETGRQLKIGRFKMVGNGKSLVEGETDGLVKVILDGELGEILGLHMYGKHATDMISELSVALTLEATADEIIDSIHPHPTVSEAIPEAFMAAYGKAIHSL